MGKIDLDALDGVIGSTIPLTATEPAGGDTPAVVSATPPIVLVPTSAPVTAAPVIAVAAPATPVTVTSATAAPAPVTAAPTTPALVPVTAAPTTPALATAPPITAAPTPVDAAAQSGGGVSAATVPAMAEGEVVSSGGTQSGEPRRKRLWLWAIAAAAIPLLGVAAWLGATAEEPTLGVRASTPAGRPLERAAPAVEPVVGVESPAAPRPTEDSDESAGSSLPTPPAESAQERPADLPTPPPAESAEGRTASFPEQLVTRFRTSSAEVSPRSHDQLRWIAHLLQGCSNGFVITGHTDDAGTEEMNQRLGEQRAQQVLSALSAAGVDTAQARIDSAGSSRPVTSNRTWEGRHLNRRVTVACR